MSRLWSPFSLRALTCRNRIVVSPMCQYSSTDGLPTDWHLVHLGSRAVGGAGLVMVEATAVSPDGRISPADSGLWSARHADAYRRITAFVAAQGARIGVQLAHAGRKASTDAPWRGGGPLTDAEGGWQPLAPSAEPFSDRHPVPRALSRADLAAVVAQFVDATGHAVAAGFDLIELHMAHGYLCHEFLSPLANHRDDEYGGSLDNRMRFPLEVARAVREAWPADRPLLVRLSATDWIDGGWDLAQSIVFARALKAAGVDLVDCSSGGIVPHAPIPAGPGYQVPLAAAIRRDAGIPTGAVGLITEPVQAEQIIATGQADVVLLARELLRDPYWPLHAAHALHDEVAWPPQYQRAKP
ncbi:MAG TPA: NADH:flavin oxidoreductase/NADH oxidase [Vicinamibacterales bacterium]|nr:NADH:flavin oxidoreductase/NADH oxidase [Vicinamibacterales bacterium]